MPPANSSQADIVVDAEKLLAATQANASTLPGIDDQRLPLEQTLAEIKLLLYRQQTLKADGQKATQDLKEALARARDQMIQLRAAVKAKLGPRTEKLVEFRVAPLRRRRSVAKPAPTEPAGPPIEPPANPPATV